MLAKKVRTLVAACVVVMALASGIAGIATASARSNTAARTGIKTHHRAHHPKSKRHRRGGKRDARKKIRGAKRTPPKRTKRTNGPGTSTSTTPVTSTQGVPSTPVTSPSSGPSTPSIYWGATIGSQLTGEQAPWDMTAVSDFASESGKGPSLVHFGTPFASCGSTTASSCSDESFPTTPMTNIRGYGAIPFLDWSSVAMNSDGISNALPSSLSAVIDGDWDSYITSFAEAAKAWGHPFFLRFDWEMNGNWFPWSEGVNGNTTGQFVAAWRHVHDIFTKVGATNASWVWCPNVDFANAFTSLQELYPGNSYVDWTCLDGYNWGSNPAQAGGASLAQSDRDNWQSFDQIFQSTYNEIVNTVAPGKPMIVGEVGATEDGGSKAAWISNMLSEIPVDYPDVHGLMYTDQYDSGMDWPIETSSSAMTAWQSGIAPGAYVPNNYSDISASPIPVPTA
jgi:Glycosyl hydrolase family 26